MHVRLLRQVTDGNKTYYPGEIAVVSDELGKTYIEREWAEEVKPPKVHHDAAFPKETTEQPAETPKRGRRKE